MTKLLNPRPAAPAKHGRALQILLDITAERRRHAREGTELSALDDRLRRDVGLTSYDAAWLQDTPVRGPSRLDVDALMAHAHAARGAAMRRGLRALWGWLRGSRRRAVPTDPPGGKPAHGFRGWIARLRGARDRDEDAEAMGTHMQRDIGLLGRNRPLDPREDMARRSWWP
ncbi:RSP_7527 family protein [Falsiroseomonas sp.]|uniref:RSP_7527 family protein n=1 Tax=Falsiroseomonas sp. TaxID=2870721 RepID=UPI002735E040|nr:hypothetical protein [Falsiroseomonas sp.]MDP3415938.1 hypothetical protein [Falsiroseomonas sp.]